MKAQYELIKVRELTEYGDWPWRYVVEGLLPATTRKPWPWSRKAVRVPARWARLRHGLHGLEPMQDDDARALARHYGSPTPGASHE